MAMGIKFGKFEGFFFLLFAQRREGCRAQQWQGESTPADINVNAWRIVYSPRMRFAVRPSLPQAEKRVAAIVFIVHTLKVLNPSLLIETALSP